MIQDYIFNCQSLSKFIRVRQRLSKFIQVRQSLSKFIQVRQSLSELTVRYQTILFLQLLTIFSPSYKINI